MLEQTIVQNEIVREMIFKASRERVWRALTDPAEVSKWFSTQTEIDLTPGGKVSFYWKEHDDTCPGFVEAVEPMTRFAFKWKPFLHIESAMQDESIYLHVEYTLEDHPHGTKMTMRESGFAKLPAEFAKRSRTDNEFGWTEELAELHALLAESKDA